MHHASVANFITQHIRYWLFSRVASSRRNKIRLVTNLRPAKIIVLTVRHEIITRWKPLISHNIFCNRKNFPLIFFLRNARTHIVCNNVYYVSVTNVIHCYPTFPKSIIMLNVSFYVPQWHFGITVLQITKKITKRNYNRWFINMKFVNSQSFTEKIKVRHWRLSVLMYINRNTKYISWRYIINNLIFRLNFTSN